MAEQILIIESDTKKLRRLREILSREGFNLITVTDKDSALNICRKLNIDYILGNTSDLLKLDEYDSE